MKVAVIGAAGRQALAAIYDFVENKSVEKVLLIDIVSEALEARKSLVNSDKVEARIINIADTKTLSRALDDYDACVNCTTHKLNLAVMEACILSRTNYTDLGGLFHWAKEQIKKHDEFEKAGITGIVGSGSAPGIVNVFAKYAADRLDTVHTIRILDGIVNRAGTGGRFVPPYALDTLIDEFTANNYEFKDGKEVELPPFSGEVVVDFPEPIGRQTLYNMIHSEVATMPIYFAHKKIRNVSFKLAVPKLFEDRLRFLVDVGFGSKDCIDVKGTRVAPRDVLIALVEKSATAPEKSKLRQFDDHKDLRVIVSGEKDGRNMTYQVETVIHPYEKWNMPMGPFSVGFPAAVTTRLLGGGKIKEKGFFSSEAVIDPQMYFDELAERNIKVSVQVTEELN
jgi:saccharopine dehydrogenase-like NADP-dependent oxidoreductase